MKVWVVEWRSAVLDYGEGGWHSIKGVFSTEEAAETYARSLEPKTTNLTAALLCPQTEVHEFTLDEIDDDETV